MLVPVKIPCVIISFLLLTKFISSEIVTCKSPIYCKGDLLRVIQMARIFKDSKTFVDMSLIQSTERTLKSFDKMMAKTRGAPEKEDIIRFVQKNFQASYNELENWYPTDYQVNPPFLRKIKDTKVRNMAKMLLDLWPHLGRKIKPEVVLNPHKHSLIPLPHGFIVPGGRFREIYYWDTYWIVKGLLICDMKHTVKGIIDNFLYMVDTYGFIPNGGRVYYLDRSQPPLLTMMANEYIDATNDILWLKDKIQILEKEIIYWTNSKTKVIQIDKNGKKHRMFRFHSSSDTPRPESYIEDVHTASRFRSEDEKKRCYLNLRTGAETGWDFSARWFFDGQGGNRADLSTIKPTRLIPVDLNAFLCKDFFILHKFYKKLRKKDKSKYWLAKYVQLKEAIKDVLYNPTNGIWFDYDIELGIQRQHFFPSNFAPLWAEAIDSEAKKSYGQNATNYLKTKGILNYEGGIPSSLYESGEQWDLPNAWAPSQSMVILGLDMTEDPSAQETAHELAFRWMNSLMLVADDTHEMFEKYNAMFKGMYGGGGEYEVQTGFGWTNGVMLELIEYYFIKKKDDDDQS